MRRVTSLALAPLIVLALGIAIDLWVYADATQRAEDGRPVVLRAGAFVIDSPAAWTVGCLLLWIVFFPLYLANRG